MELRTRSAWLAVGVAPLAAAQGLLHNAVGPDWWPFVIDDLVAGVFLGTAALLVIRGTTSTWARLLSGAWGVTAAVLWTSLFWLLQIPDGPEFSHVPESMAFVVAIMLVASGLGLAWSLPTTKKPFIGTRPPPEDDKPAAQSATRKRTAKAKRPA